MVCVVLCLECVSSQVCLLKLFVERSTSRSTVRWRDEPLAEFLAEFWQQVIVGWFWQRVMEPMAGLMGWF